MPVGCPAWTFLLMHVALARTQPLTVYGLGLNALQSWLVNAHMFWCRLSTCMMHVHVRRARVKTRSVRTGEWSAFMFYVIQ